MVVIALVSGCTSRQVHIYRGGTPSIEETALIRVPRYPERNHGLSHNNPKVKVVTQEVTHVADITHADGKLNWIKASSARVLPGRYKVGVSCYFSVYPVQISSSFIDDLTVEAGYDYLLECLGNIKSAYVDITQRPSIPSSAYLIGQLQSNDAFEIRLAAQTVERRKEQDTVVLDRLVDVMFAQSIIPDELSIDAVAWSCKGLAASGNRRYFSAIKSIVELTKNDKTASNCSHAASVLGGGDSIQYMPNVQ